MTRIDFYTKVPDKLRLAGKLCAKALSQQHLVNIYAPDESVASRLDRLLWTDQSLSFLPHCRAEDALAPETPILIHTQDSDALHGQLLVNLDQSWPPAFSRFDRVIEIVSTEEADAAAARERYRFYRDRGYEIKTHDMSAA